MTKRLIEARYLKPRYRLGRRIVVGTEIRIDGAVPNRIELIDHVTDRRGITFDQFPPVFRQSLLENVRKGLEEPPTPHRLPGDRVIPGP